jgi:protein-tyrosine phosphatase
MLGQSAKGLPQLRREFDMPENSKKFMLVALAMAMAMVMAITVMIGCGNEAPPERHVELEGQSNTRDLGGYETSDGRTLKWGQVYRSGELPHLSDGDVTKLEDLKIGCVVNFLLPQEIEMNGRDRLPAGAREIAEPIQGERAAKLTMVAQSAIRSGEFDKIPPEMNPEFHRLLLEEGKPQYAALLRYAADPANRPLMFHCSHGVHRTGTATAILLSALGVPWETVREDYLLTNEYRADEVKVTLEKLRHMVAEKKGVAPEDIDMSNVEAFYVLEGSYIDGSLDQAVAEYGSMQAYIREGLGISDEEIELLKSQLLE